MIKRNNPGNIKKDDRWTWKGEVPGTSSGEIITFDSLVLGYRALMIDLNNKIKKGYNTLDKIIPRFAPKADGNPTEAYIAIAFVSTQSGINPTKILVPGDFSILSKLALVMSFFEHGVRDNDGTLKAAINKAKEMLTGVIDTVKEEVKAHPVVTLLVVAGIIYLITR